MQSRPNLLFVFSDQHRWCDLGCYGSSQVLSPNLDAFARQSVRFEQCVSNCPVCVPARGTLLTGLMPLRHRAVTNDLPLQHGLPSVAGVLAGAGYRTGYVGKWHLAGVPRDQAIPAGPGRFGFQEWKVCNCSHAYLNAYYFDEANRRVAIQGYEPATQTDLAADFVRRNQPGPWCLFLSWGPPHDPYDQVPARYLEIFRRSEIQLRLNVPAEVMLTLSHRIPREQVVAWYQGYYAHIAALDEQFGRLMAALEQSGQAENTVVVYTSDHGDMLGSQGLANKQLPYEESVRVPLIARWPGRTWAGASQEMISLVDLPVSLLGLMGQRFPGAVDGADLHRLFTDPGARGPDACYLCDLIPCHQAVARGGTEWRAIRTRRHTLARSAEDEGYVLYDNVGDPYQMQNLVGRPHTEGLRRELLAQLDGFIARHDALLGWEGLVRHYGLREEWNRSQRYFGLPEVP